MGKLSLYCAIFSPPARACIITAKLIGLDLDLKYMDLPKKEHLSEEYLKLNPQHTIPLLVDDGISIWDSHAIITYMVSKYAKDDALYPKDLIKRAHIDQRLHFETGVLFQVIKDFVNRVISGGEKEYNPSTIKWAHTGYDFLEKFLVDDYVVGNTMTVADVSINTTVITLKKFVPIEKEQYPRITSWLEKMKSLPDYEEVNEKGANALYNRIKSVLEQNIANSDNK